MTSRFRRHTFPANPTPPAARGRHLRNLNDHFTASGRSDPLSVKTFLIAISLALNLTLVATFTFRPKLAPPAFQDFFSRHGFSRSVETTSAKATTQRAPASVSARPLWTTLASDNPATLVARLRAAGFPASLIRALVTSELQARYLARMRALVEPDPATPFWKSTNSAILNSRRNEELMRIQQESSRLLRELFKDEFFASSDVSAAQRRQFGDLPPGKIDQLQRIEEDYMEMNRTLSATTKGVILPEDREKMALLAREKRADLEAVLSPAELAEYTMRSSPITSMLGRQLGGFDASEAEFRAIFHVQQSLNEQFPMNISGGSISSTNDEQRRTAQQQLEQQLKATLGDARYADYVRETDREFQQLNQIAQRDNLPASATAQAYHFRETVAQESNRIFDDPSLDASQKRAALQTLAQNARAQLLVTLGPTSGPAYVKVAEQWLGNIERGGAVSFKTGTGGMTSISSINGGMAVAVYSSGTSPTYRRLPNPAPTNP